MTNKIPFALLISREHEESSYLCEFNTVDAAISSDSRIKYYTLPEFEQIINKNDLNMENYWIRFFELSSETNSFFEKDDIVFIHSVEDPDLEEWLTTKEEECITRYRVVSVDYISGLLWLEDCPFAIDANCCKQYNSIPESLS